MRRLEKNDMREEGREKIGERVGRVGRKEERRREQKRKGNRGRKKKGEEDRRKS